MLDNHYQFAPNILPRNQRPIYIRASISFVHIVGNTRESGLQYWLDHTLRLFAHDSRYAANDTRYLKLWLQGYLPLVASASSGVGRRAGSDARAACFAYMTRNGVGMGLAAYYEALAGFLEEERGRCVRN